MVFLDKENAPAHFKTPGVKQTAAKAASKIPLQVRTPLTLKNVSTINAKQTGLLKEVVTAKAQMAAPRTALQNITNKTPHVSKTGGKVTLERPVKTTKRSSARESKKVLHEQHVPGLFGLDDVSQSALKSNAQPKEVEADYEIEYMPPRQEEQPWDPGFTVDFTSLSAIVSSDAYEYAHLFYTADEDDLPAFQFDSMKRKDDPIDECLLPSAFDTAFEEGEGGLSDNLFEDFLFDV
jgi:hypothetical protein